MNEFFVSKSQKKFLSNIISKNFGENGCDFGSQAPQDSLDFKSKGKIHISEAILDQITKESPTANTSASSEPQSDRTCVLR